MIRRVLTIALLFFLSLSMAGKEVYAYRDSVKNGYNFLLYLPDTYYQGRHDLPVVIFLHGRSLTGTNLASVLRYGSLDAIQRGLPIEAIIIAPQTPIIGWNADKVMHVLDFVTERVTCDLDRVYVLGMSMGGWGTLKVAEYYPDRVAAAMAICGGYTEPSIDGLLQVPLWVMSGSNDNVTPYRYSFDLMTKMMATGKSSRLRFDLLDGMGHSDVARLFYLDDTYRWLFCHNLQDKERRTDRSILLPVEKVKDAYSAFDPEMMTKLKIVAPPASLDNSRPLDEELVDMRPLLYREDGFSFFSFPSFVTSDTTSVFPVILPD